MVLRYYRIVAHKYFNRRSEQNFYSSATSCILRVSESNHRSEPKIH